MTHWEWEFKMIFTDRKGNIGNEKKEGAVVTLKKN